MNEATVWELSQRVRLLETALRETREVLVALYVARHDDFETEECVAIKAVLAHYAELVGEENKANANTKND